MYGRLGNCMEVMVDDQTITTVVDVGAARLTRLKLHRFGSFDVGQREYFEEQ